jgi:hypothetical protein
VALAIVRAVPATGLSEGERIASAAGISPAAVAAAGTPSEEVRGDTTGQELATPAAEELLASVPGVVVEGSVVAAEGPGVVAAGAGKALGYMAAWQNEIARLFQIGQRLAIGNNVYYPSQKGEKGIP